MTAQAFAATVVGLAAATTLLVLTLRRPVRPPQHRVLWIVALILIGASIAFRLVLLVGLTINAGPLDAGTVATGSLAVVLVFLAAFRQPSWAGWALIASAGVVPLLTWLLGIVTGEPSAGQVAGPMLFSYGIPAVITGVLLVLSTRASGAHGAVSA